MIIENSKSKVLLGNLKSGDIFSVVDAVFMKLHSRSENTANSVNLRTGELLLIGDVALVTPYPQAKLIL